MIIVVLTYKAPLSELDAATEAHRAWLREGLASGILLMAGRQVPRIGGIFFTRGTKDEAIEWSKGDPFQTLGLSDYSFIEVSVTMTAEGLEALKG